jgi:hypothetical protein
MTASEFSAHRGRIREIMEDAFVVGLLCMSLGEGIVVVPGNPRRSHRGLLGAERDLVGELIRQPEVHQQRPFHCFMKYQKGLSADAPALRGKRARRVAVEVNGFAVAAAPAQIWHVVLPVDLHAGVYRGDGLA